MSSIGEILELYAREGQRQYGGERVSQTEHALQAAELAARDGAPETLVAAALLHDIGHLLPLLAGKTPARDHDGRHEAIGAGWLVQTFGPEVAEPVRLHVDAKRYLCGSEPDYARGLSPASEASLALQGGALDPEERAEFETRRFWREAVRLRRWDERAKVAGLSLPPFASHRALLEALAG